MLSLLIPCSVLVICAIPVAQSGTWQETGRYFEMFMDVGINDAQTAYSAVLANGEGSIWSKTENFGANWTVLEVRDGFFDLACSSLSSREAVMSGLLGKVLYTWDAGASVRTSVGVAFGSQCISRTHNVDANKIDTPLYGAPGGDGIDVSDDRGLTWKHYKDNDQNASMNYIRYSALPSDSVWYLTAGIWVEASDNDDDGDDGDDDQNRFKVNSRLQISYDSVSGKYESKWKFGKKVKKNSNSVPGIWGEIWKTTDAGATFNRVYSNYGHFYFNAIDCCSESVCYAVAEGDSDAGSIDPGTRILQTMDGGMTWNITYFNPLDGASLMGVHCISENEAYAAGGTIIERDFHGDFLHTTDAGASWIDAQVDVPILFMDMSDSGQTGIATGITKSSEGVIYGFF